MSIKGWKDENGHIERYDMNSLDAPFTAEVGHILEVAEVDENGKPTKWKAIPKSSILNALVNGNEVAY